MLLTITPEKKLDNESCWPKTYTSKFLQAGLVDYSDMPDGHGGVMGILNLPKETIDEHLVNSFIDKPVVVKHKDVNEENFTSLAVGFIKNIYYNAIDGWYYCDFIIHKDEGHEKIKNGWGVSCAYKVGQLGQGGKKNNIVYNGSIVSGEGEHLALVQNPRYEECRVIINGKPGIIYNEAEFHLRNNKQEDKTMWLFGKKEDKGFAGETLVDIGNGKKAKLADIIAFNNSVAEKHDIDPKTEIVLTNGKKLTLEEAVTAFAAQNASIDDKEKEDEAKDKKKDEGKDAEKKAENAKKLSNCGCGGEGDKHKAGCTMYNEDGSDKKDKGGDEDKMKNALDKLTLENEALKAAAKNMDNFVKLNNARRGNEDITLENSTSQSGTIENKLENSRKFFTAVKK